MTTGIYGHPALYAAFHQLEPELIRAALGWAKRAVRAPRRGHSRKRPPGTGIPHVHRVYEPACGPGQWLAVFARMGCQVTGLDMQPAMVAAAKRAVAKASVFCGDMSAPPSDLLETAAAEPFDLALNLHGSVGHLPSPEAFERHLRATWLMLRPGGVYMVGVTIRSGRRASDPMELGQYGPTQVGGGWASLRSLSLGAAAGSPYERIHHMMMTFGVEGAGPLIAETYDLLTFPLPWLKRALKRSGPWEVVAAHSMLEDGFPKVRLSAESSDVTLILRRA
ncbi:MAG: class I SAM-dependent methyltransferase [Phycisphaerales bacterium]